VSQATLDRKDWKLDQKAERPVGPLAEGAFGTPLIPSSQSRKMVEIGQQVSAKTIH